MPDAAPPQPRPLHVLRAAFAGQLPERRREIEVLAGVLQAEGWTPTSGQALFHAAHRLAGSAAIFGYDDVRRVALEIEGLVTALLEGESPHCQPLGPELGSLVEALKQFCPDRPPESTT